VIAHRCDGSITKYGRRFCEIAEGRDARHQHELDPGSTTLADALMSDLANPVAEHEGEVPFFRFVELGDLYQFNADGIHYDSDQKLAVTGYAHRLTSGDKPQSRTTLQCRGKPSAGFRRWHGKIDGDLHALDLDNSSGLSMLATPVVGGTRVSIVTGDTHKKALPLEHEIHVSASSGFTPSNSTLVSQGANNSVVVPDLIPGKTYYARAHPRGHNRSRPVRGQPSAEFSFVAGQAAAGHIQSGIAVGDYPLNGGFETRFDAAGMPDHWTVYSGTFGTNVQVMEDGNGLSGGRYLRLLGGGARSAVYPMLQEANEANRRGSIYRFHWWRKAGTSAAAYSALIRLLDYVGAEILQLTVGASMPVTTPGHWVREELFVRLREGDAGARSLQLQLSGGNTGANQQIDIDEVRCQYLGTAWIEIGDTTYFTENYQAVPGFLNSWVNFDPVNEAKAAFRKDQFGRVEIKASIKSGSIAAPAWVMPSGFRPKMRRAWSVPAGGGTGMFAVYPNGNVQVEFGSNTLVDIHVSYMTTDVSTTLT
jgi:hypothetical protein